MPQKDTFDWTLPETLTGPQYQQQDPRHNYENSQKHGHNCNQLEPAYRLFLSHRGLQGDVRDLQTPGQAHHLQTQHHIRNSLALAQGHAGTRSTCNIRNIRNTHTRHCSSSHTVEPQQFAAALQHPERLPPSLILPHSSNRYQTISVRPKPPRASTSSSSSSSSPSSSRLLPATPMQRTPPPTEQSVQDIRAIVSAVVSPSSSSHLDASKAEGAVHSIVVLPNPSYRPQQVYEVDLSSTPIAVSRGAAFSTTASTALADRILVVMPPPATLKLLRSEQKMTRSESVVVRWLLEEVAQRMASAGSNKTPSPSPHAAASPGEDEHDDEEEEDEHEEDDKDHPRSAPVGYSALRATSDNNLLLRCLPSPVPLPRPLSKPLTAAGHSLSSSWGFNVYASPVGSPVAALDSPLTEQERRTVNFQAGQLMSQLAQLAPGSKKFGPALAVLSTNLEDAASASAATRTWSTAFHSILEGILRDGEDIAVSLAYPTIRRHFRRLGYLLDRVTVPSLVVVDAMDNSNLLVQRRPSKSKEKATAQSKIATPQTTTASGSESEGEGDDEDSSDDSDDSNDMALHAQAVGISVTGLRDWSNCVFGDPLFATVFSEQPSAAFLRGFQAGVLSTHASSSLKAVFSDSKEHRYVRMLLYQCYHAVVQIVRGFYRPGRDQTTHELAARKRLTEILAKLEAVDVEELEGSHIEDAANDNSDQEHQSREQSIDPKSRLRHRRSSAEIWPAKKPRSNAGDDPPQG